MSASISWWIGSVSVVVNHSFLLLAHTQNIHTHDVCVSINTSIPPYMGTYIHRLLRLDVFIFICVAIVVVVLILRMCACVCRCVCVRVYSHYLSHHLYAENYVLDISISVCVCMGGWGRTESSISSSKGSAWPSSSGTCACPCDPPRA